MKEFAIISKGKIVGHSFVNDNKPVPRTIEICGARTIGGDPINVFRAKTSTAKVSVGEAREKDLFLKTGEYYEWE